MPDTGKNSIFDRLVNEAEEARLDSVADAEIEAGRCVAHDKVADWLKSWGTDDELPCPQPAPR